MLSDFDPSAFSGIGRLFPLPNVVLFPAVLIRLHIFEPRYRQMVADALADDRLIVLTLLAPGWESDYEGKPPISPVGCLGRILQEERLPDGRYNLILQGLARVRIEAELEASELYRKAKVRLIPDRSPSPGAPELAEIRAHLARICRQRFGGEPQISEAIDDLLASELPLGALADLLTYAIALDLETKQAILAQPDVLKRAALLLQAFAAPKVPLVRKSASAEQFPPPFSAN